jgi:hypothetical protein
VFGTKKLEWSRFCGSGAAWSSPKHASLFLGTFCSVVPGWAVLNFLFLAVGRSKLGLEMLEIFYIFFRIFKNKYQIIFFILKRRHVTNMRGHVSEHVTVTPVTFQLK